MANPFGMGKVQMWPWATAPSQGLVRRELPEMLLLGDTFLRCNHMMKGVQGRPLKHISLKIVDAGGAGFAGPRRCHSSLTSLVEVCDASTRTLCFCKALGCSSGFQHQIPVLGVAPAGHYLPNTPALLLDT